MKTGSGATLLQKKKKKEKKSVYEARFLQDARFSSQGKI